MVENEIIKNSKRILKVASSIQQLAITNNLFSRFVNEKDDVINLYDKIVTDDQLKEITKELFFEKHYALAVEEAFKFLNNLVKNRSNITADGADLMRTTFSPKNPILKMSSLKTESQKNQQRGYMDIFAGCMTGIRNPRAHEHWYLDSPQPALEMLSLANHLIITVRQCKKARKKCKLP